jgi:predicted GIY-YIG superfamily endonuclease
MKSVMVAPMVYVLELEDACWYVGITHNLNLRFAQHMAGDGAVWTKMHRPIRVYDVYSEDASLRLENEVTQKFMEEFGADKVRGGSWCYKTPKGKHMTPEQFKTCIEGLGLAGSQSNTTSNEASE